MTNTTQSALDALSEKATQGEWGVDLQYADNGGRYLEIANSSYDVVIGEYGVGADDAVFIVALVNAYRTGHLTVADPAAIAAAEARGFERGIRETVNEANALSAYHQTGSRSGPFGDVSASALEALIARLLAKLESGQ